MLVGISEDKGILGGDTVGIEGDGGYGTLLGEVLTNQNSHERPNTNLRESLQIPNDNHSMLMNMN